MRLIPRARREIRQRVDAASSAVQRKLIAPLVQAAVAKTEAGEGEDLLFVSGFDKSGTTWLMSMLDSHPEIVCRGSGQFFNYHLPDLKYLGNPSGYSVMRSGLTDNDWWRASGHTWLSEQGANREVARVITTAMRSYRLPGVRLLGDKSTVQDLRLIQEVFPRSRRVVIVRDGRDVAVSFAYHFERRGARSRFVGEKQIDSDFVEAVAQSWAAYAKHVYEHRSSITVMIYERLLVDPAVETQRLLRDLGLTADAATVERITAKTSFEQLTGGRKTGEEDRSSFFRKGVVGDWRNHFTPEQTATFWKHAGEAMELWGYAR